MKSEENLERGRTNPPSINLPFHLSAFTNNTLPLLNTACNVILICQSISFKIYLIRRHEQILSRTVQLTLLRGKAWPARHKIVLQSPALATKSLFLTIKAATAVQPGCQSFWITPLDLRWESSSFLNAASVLTNASNNASVGLHPYRKLSYLMDMYHL